MFLAALSFVIAGSVQSYMEVGSDYLNCFMYFFMCSGSVIVCTCDSQSRGNWFEILTVVASLQVVSPNYNLMRDD